MAQSTQLDEEASLAGLHDVGSPKGGSKASAAKPGDAFLASAKTTKAGSPIASPVTGTVEQRVAKLRAYSEAKYKCHLIINQAERKADQAQKFHICHMFLYNKFDKLRPKKDYLAKDKRTISWSHLSDPKVNWLLIDRTEFLRTASGSSPIITKDEKGVLKWKEGSEPDRSATIKKMAAFLRQHHVSSMAAPGRNGCGEPCCCGGRASKHITREACDLGGLNKLKEAVEKEKGKKLDDLLHEYGLFRPMAHLKGDKREEWHVEAYDPKTGKKPNPATEGAGHKLAKHAGLAGMNVPGKPSK